MTPSHILKLLGVSVLLGACAGCCCHHKKGITLRGGLDFREYKKPAGFVELVETGWDERRRMQDLRWLENADYTDPTTPAAAPPQTELDAPPVQPPEELPALDEPPKFKLPPMPEEPPPVPGAEPDSEPDAEPMPQLQEQFELDEEVDEFEESATLPTDYTDEEDYRQILEMTRYEQPVRTIANRPTVVPQSSTGRAPAQPRTDNWLWSKP